MLSIPLIILNTCIKSPLCLLCFSGNRFNLDARRMIYFSGLGSSLLLYAELIALLVLSYLWSDGSLARSFPDVGTALIA